MSSKPCPEGNRQTNKNTEECADTRRDDVAHGPVRTTRTCTTAAASLAIMPIRRREQSSVDRDRVLRLRDHRRGVRRDALTDGGLLRGVREEHEGGPRGGHLDLTRVLRLVTLDRLDRLLSLPATIRFRTCPERLPKRMTLDISYTIHVQLKSELLTCPAQVILSFSETEDAKRNLTLTEVGTLFDSPKVPPPTEIVAV